jgi:hypothetical protein
MGSRKALPMFERKSTPLAYGKREGFALGSDRDSEGMNVVIDNGFSTSIMLGYVQIGHAIGNVHSE